MERTIKMSKLTWLFSVLALVLVTIGFPTEADASGAVQLETLIRVPLDYPTIQGAVYAAVDGDTVLVAPGTYSENINFLGKEITVRSEEGPEVTIIDGHTSGSVVTFTSGEGPTSVLSGFSLQNGLPEPAGAGGGMVISYSSPTVADNIIANNRACKGGGIAINHGSPTVQQNVISYNTAEYGCSGGPGGGGILVGGNGSAQILDNVISNNSADDQAGGGIALFAAGTPTR